eukprot:gene3066-288_t
MPKLALESDDVFVRLDNMPRAQKFSYEFVVESGQTKSEHKFFVGNVKSAGSTNGEFQIEGMTDALQKLGWKVDNTKGALTPGSKIPITVTFAPTEQIFAQLPVAGVNITNTVTMTVLLKGGNPQPVGEVGNVYTIVLRGIARP